MVTIFQQLHNIPLKIIIISKIAINPFQTISLKIINKQYVLVDLDIKIKTKNR